MKMTEEQKRARREAKTAREAEENRRFEEERAALRAAAPLRMLALLARAELLDMTYTVVQMREPNSFVATFKGPKFEDDWDSSVTTSGEEWDFLSIENRMHRAEEERAEEARKAAVRKLALEKVKAALTEEELTLLNVRTY